MTTTNKASAPRDAFIRSRRPQGPRPDGRALADVFAHSPERDSCLLHGHLRPNLHHRRKKRRRGASALQTGIEEGKGGRAMSEYFDINPPALDEAPEEQEPTVKLCPRCHREPRLVRGKVICWYECCDLEGPSGQSEPEAAEEWAAYLENEVVERDADTAAREWMDEIRGEAY